MPDIPFCVEGYRAEHCIHGIACAQHMRDSLTIRLARAPDAFRQRLHRRVTEQGEAARRETCRPEFVDDLVGALQTNRIADKRK